MIFPQTLNAAIAYKSADASVASVTEDGVVTAVGEGATDVFVYSVYTNKVFAKVPVQVKYGKAIQRLLLSSGELTLKRGDTAPLGLTLYPEDASRALVYESSNPEVAYIDESGSIVAAMYGEATLRVRSYRDPSLYAEMKVTVADDHCPRTMTDAGKKERYVLRAGERLSVSPRVRRPLGGVDFQRRTHRFRLRGRRARRPFARRGDRARAERAQFRAVYRLCRHRRGRRIYAAHARAPHDRGRNRRQPRRH